MALHEEGSAFNSFQVYTQCILVSNNEPNKTFFFVYEITPRGIFN